MKLVPDNYSEEIVLEETREMIERLTSNLVEAIKEAEDIKTSFSDDLSRDFLDDLIETIKPSLILVRDFEEEFENRFGSSRTSDDYSLSIPRKKEHYDQYQTCTNRYNDDIPF